MFTLSRPLLLSLGLTLGVGATAADSPGAVQALKVLTATEAPHSAPAAAASGRESLTLQRSETMDALIRRHYAGSPFKDEVLRRALAELNPKTVPNAANNLLKRGSTLVMPNTEDLRKVLQQHYPAAAELVRVRVEVETEETPARAGSANGPDRRRWVRFP